MSHIIAVIVVRPLINLVTSSEAAWATFRGALLDKQKELLALEFIGNQESKTVELDQSCVGRVSRMDAMQSQAMALESQRRRKLELKQIATALRRMDEGNFGDCLECGEAIGSERLKFNPAVPLCITCARAAEKV